MGTHISKVRAVNADDWNDDWVDTMEKWGNARAVGFWEAKPPSHRAGPSPPGAIASRGISDFIRAKYTARLFAAAGEPGAWHATLQLSNGWTRMWDGGSRNWYYACGEVTAWEAPPESTLPPQPPVPWWPAYEGWLEKKSGGKDGESKMKLLQRWDKRYFVLLTSGTSISYYKSDEAFRKREPALGTTQCQGAKAFLKEVKGDQHRFTILSAERELKLRASAADFRAWSTALRPVVGEIGSGGKDDDE